MASPVTSPASLSGWDGLPWAVSWQDQPALLVPRGAGRPHPHDRESGWSTAREGALGAPRPGWSVAVAGQCLTITDPTGVWFEGALLLTREWIRAVYARQRLLLIAGEFDDIGQFATAAHAGQLRLLVVGTRPPGIAAPPRQLPRPGGAARS